MKFTRAAILNWWREWIVDYHHQKVERFILHENQELYDLCHTIDEKKGEPLSDEELEKIMNTDTLHWKSSFGLYFNEFRLIKIFFNQMKSRVEPTTEDLWKKFSEDLPASYFVNTSDPIFSLNPQEIIGIVSQGNEEFYKSRKFVSPFHALRLWTFMKYVQVHLLWVQYCQSHDNISTFEPIPKFIAIRTKKNLKEMFLEGEVESTKRMQKCDILLIERRKILNFIQWSFSEKQWEKIPKKEETPASLFIQCSTCSKVSAAIVTGPAKNLPEDVKSARLYSAQEEYSNYWSYNCCDNKFEVRIMDGTPSSENIHKYKIIEPETKDYSTLTITPTQSSENCFQIKTKKEVRYVEVKTTKRLDTLEDQMGILTWVDLDAFKFFVSLSLLCLFCFFIFSSYKTDDTLGQLRNEIAMLKSQVNELKSSVYVEPALELQREYVTSHSDNPFLFTPSWPSFDAVKMMFYDLIDAVLYICRMTLDYFSPFTEPYFASLVYTLVCCSYIHFSFRFIDYFMKQE